MSKQRDPTYYHAWMSSRVVSRRGLFRSLFAPGKRAFVQQTSTQGMSDTLQRQAARPPQAVAEPLFLRRCDGCGKCVASCPLGIIQIHDDAKVRLNMDYAECDFCALCTSVCHSGALEPNVPMDTGLRPVISLHCLGRLDDLCRMCEVACPNSAIYFNQDSQPEIDYRRCNGCGKCKSVCYHGDISLSIP